MEDAASSADGDTPTYVDAVAFVERLLESSVVRRTVDPQARAVLERTLAAVAHRGPDGPLATAVALLKAGEVLFRAAEGRPKPLDLAVEALRAALALYGRRAATSSVDRGDAAAATRIFSTEPIARRRRVSSPRTIRVPAAATRLRGLSASQRRRRRDSSPRTIEVRSRPVRAQVRRSLRAGAPRDVRRGVHGIFGSRPRRRSDSIYPRRSRDCSPTDVPGRGFAAIHPSTTSP